MWEALALGAGCEQQFRGAKAGDVSLCSVTTDHEPLRLKGEPLSGLAWRGRYGMGEPWARSCREVSDCLRPALPQSWRVCSGSAVWICAFPAFQLYRL